MGWGRGDGAAGLKGEGRPMVKKTGIFGLTLAGLVLGAVVGQAAVLESPAAGAVLSGLGFISGWKCDASNITIVIDENGEHLPVAMHQERGDLRGVCGDAIRHGFIKQINWALLGGGEHIVVAYDAGVEFARATFTVGTTGEEFLKDVTRRTVLDGFPAPGERALLEWNESTQHFEIVTVWGMALDGEYDRSFWRQYTSDQAEGAFTTDEELYAELPDLDGCVAGRLSQAAKNRALTAANQIRALHGLTPLLYSALYSQQVQEAALIQAANSWGITRYLNHFPEPGDQCYTEAGATGSGTSNLIRRRNRDPAVHMVAWTDDGVVPGSGHRRWILNPFAAYSAYGQVYEYAAHKVARYDREPRRTVLPQVDYVAFPYEVYPYHLVAGDPPWSFSVIVDPNDYWANQGDYFREATISVTRAKDETTLPITDRYTDALGYGIPNFLSWRVEGWEYDTLYQVEIANVILSGGLRESYSYSVFIERQNLEE